MCAYVTLPMAALGSAVDGLGPFVDADAILDGILRGPRSAWPAAFVATREITPQLLGPLGCPIDESINVSQPTAGRRHSFPACSQLEICSGVHLKVTKRRAAEDFAACTRELTDVHYPRGERIGVVLDNLSTHSAGPLYQAFPGR